MNSNCIHPAELARQLLPLVTETRSFRSACRALGISPKSAAYTLMRAGLYNAVLRAKYEEVRL